MLRPPDWLLYPLRTWRRRRLLAQPFPPAWEPHLARLPFYERMEATSRQRLRDDLRILIAEKNWEGCGGLALTDEMRVVIAATAALLLLGLDHDHYQRVSSILVYPSGWRVPGRMSPSGELQPERSHLGEAWQQGPVVLAWDAARHGSFDPKDGHNLVLHEFAHQLDFMDGIADGRPPLRASTDARTWRETLQREFDALTAADDRGKKTLLDPYGATNPAEFFAVATECFFERGPSLRARHPALYDELRRYYGQDPAGRASTPGV